MQAPGRSPWKIAEHSSWSASRYPPPAHSRRQWRWWQVPRRRPELARIPSGGHSHRGDVGAAAAGDEADHGAAAVGQSLLAAGREAHAGHAAVLVLGDDDGVVVEVLVSYFPMRGFYKLKLSKNNLHTPKNIDLPKQKVDLSKIFRYFYKLT